MFTRRLILAAAVALATGVLIVSMRGSNIDLLHVLFGSVLALDDATLMLIAAFATITLLALAVGIMMLPAIAARFWATDLTRMIAISVGIAFVSGYGGLLLSYHFAVPSGPAIILVAGLFYIVSLVLGPVGGLRRRFAPGRHLEA